MQPCLPLRLQVLSLLKRLGSLPHTRQPLNAALLESLRALRKEAAGGRDGGRQVGALLAVGGALEMLMAWGDADGESAGGSPLEEDVVLELMEAVADVLEAEVRSEGGGVAGRVVQTRLLKAMWELLRLRRVQKECEGKGKERLLRAVVALAQRQSCVPIIMPDEDEVQGPVYVFSDLDWHQNRMPRVTLSDGGRTCKIESANTVRIGEEMRPHSGSYYVEFLVHETREWGFVGVGDNTFALKDNFAKTGLIAWSNDDNCALKGCWTRDALRRLETGGFAQGDVVGVLLDTDEGKLLWTKNGAVHAEFTRELPAASSFWFMVCCKDGIHLSTNYPPLYRHGKATNSSSLPRTMVGGRLRPQWLTLEMIIAKAQALAVQMGTSEGGASSAAAAEERETAGVVSMRRHRQRQPVHPIRRYAEWCYDEAKAWVHCGEHQAGKASVTFPDYSENLFVSSSAAPKSSQKAKTPGEGQALSAWRTWGREAELLAEMEEALAISYARLITLDLLSAGHLAMAKLVDAQALLAVISPYFPSSAPTEGRPVFQDGPYSHTASVMDKAVGGWLAARQGADPTQLTVELRRLSKECREGLQGVICAHFLQSKGTCSLSAPFVSRDGRVLPSMLAHVVPSCVSVDLEEQERGSEVELFAGVSMGLAAWMSQHLCQPSGLAGRAGCGEDLAGLMQTLLEAVSVLSEPSMRVQVQKALIAAMAGCAAETADRWQQQADPLLQQLHVDTLGRLLVEQSSGVSNMFYSPLLQSFASTLVASDLAIAHQDAVEAVKCLRGMSMSSKSSVPKHSEKTQKVINALLDMGFPQKHVEAGMKATGNDNIGDIGTEKFTELVEWCCTNPQEEGADVAEEEAPKAEDEGWRAKRDPKTEQALLALEGLLLVRQAVSDLRDNQPLPAWLLDMAKAEVASKEQFMSWDDRDALGGVRVEKRCTSARRRRGLDAGAWAVVLGNLPFSEHFNFQAVSVPRAGGGGWARGLQIGVVLVEREWSAEERAQLRRDGAARASVMWPIGSDHATVRSLSGEVKSMPMAGMYRPGCIVGLHVKPGGAAVEFFCKKIGASTGFSKMGEVEIPTSAGAISLLASIKSAALACAILDETPPPTVKSGKREKRSVAFGPRAFPARNGLSRQPDQAPDSMQAVDWEAALDPSWSPSTDALLVEYAVQRAAAKNVSIDKLHVLSLFPERRLGAVHEGGAASGEHFGISKILAREPSRLPPTIRSMSQVFPSWTAEFSVGVSLSQMSVPGLEARFALLKVFNGLVQRVLPLVDLRMLEHKQEMAHMLARCKGLIFPHIKSELFNKTVSKSAESGEAPHVTLNRGTRTADRRRKERTLFMQLMQHVDKNCCKLIKLTDKSGNKMSWVVSFEGEGGSDYGGLYRDSIREMSAELQCESAQGLQLFLPCPNQRFAAGSNQDKWVPNPSSRSEQHLNMYRFVGKLMGACVRANAPIELDFPGLVWKRIVGEECTFADIAAVDEAFGKDVEQLRGIASQEEWEQKGRTWRVRSLSGRMVDLVPGGRKVAVEWEEREAYMHDMVRLRLAESAAQIEAMREGIQAVVPGIALPLFTWRELEVRVCGMPVIDVDKLEKLTNYENFANNARHPVAVMFWNVVRGMSDEDRGSLLAFTWGKRRMPAQNSGAQFKLRFTQGMGDSHMPVSHTCFFQLDLPNYSGEEVMREKLLYAIRCCSAIDNDSRAGGTLYESDDEGTREEEAQEDEDDLGWGVLGGGNGDGQRWLSVPLDGGHTTERLQACFPDGLAQRRGRRPRR